MGDACLLACRSAAQADWMRHVVCAVDASPLHMSASGMRPPEAQLRLLQRMLCALHARTVCVVQARASAGSFSDSEGALSSSQFQVANLRSGHALGPGTDAQLLDAAERCQAADAVLQSALQQCGARIAFTRRGAQHLTSPGRHRRAQCRVPRCAERSACA